MKSEEQASDPNVYEAPQTDEAPPKTGTDDVARQSGRGGLAIVFAKLWFLVMGLVQNIILPRVLGAGGFGDFRNAQSVASIFYNPIVTSSIQGGSRAVAQSEDEATPQVVRRVLGIHAAMAVFFAAVFFFAAPFIANVLKAPQIIPLLRTLAGVIFCYALYSPLVGVLNGQRRFGRQALLDIVMAALRTVGLIVGAKLVADEALRAEGALSGFVVSSVVILGLSLFMVGVGRAGRGGVSARSHLAFMLPVWLGQIALNFLLQADVNLLRRFAGTAAEQAGLGVEAASPLVGAYAATQLYCFLPYQLLLSITFVLFPMLATAYRDGDREAMARYVRTGVRLAVVLAGAMVSVTSGLSEELLKLLFQKEYWVATQAMEVLTLGFGVFAIFGIFSAVLNSLKRELASMLVTVTAVILVAALCFARVPGTEFGEDLLWKTATSTSAGILLATVLAGVLVKRAAGGVVSPLSVARVILAMTVAIAVARHLPYAGKLMTLVYAAVVVAIYMLVLLITRELGAADVQNIKAVISRRKK
ncbi:MAG: lipopolysaccharide biosynthesis protein [Polyangiaceae bacterium]